MINSSVKSKLLSTTDLISEVVTTGQPLRVANTNGMSDPLKIEFSKKNNNITGAITIRKNGSNFDVTTKLPTEKSLESAVSLKLVDLLMKLFFWPQKKRVNKQ